MTLWFLVSLIIMSSCLVTCMPEIHPNLPGCVPRPPNTRTSCPDGLKTCTRQFPESPTRIYPSGSTARTSGCLNCPFLCPIDPNSTILLLSCLLYTFTLRLPLSRTMTRSLVTAMLVGAFSSVQIISLVSQRVGAWDVCGFVATPS